ncbi:MAG: flagellar biosynthetic protein FliR, partial [Acidobacteriota bacterium]
MNSFGAVVGFGLLLVRPAMLVIVTPFFGALNAPPQMRVGVTLILAFILAPIVRTPEALSATALAVVITREVAIGLALALAIRTLIFAAEFAGQFAGYQLGLSMGALIDPQSGVRNNALALLYANVAVIVCFAANAHHLLVRALVDSYRSLPMG